jgi:hypothetical protein
MKLQNTGQDTVELDFEIPQPGISIAVFTEGIQKYTNENSGKTSLQLPLEIDQVVEGPEGNVGLRLTHWCPIETEWGEKQLAGILTITGLIQSFSDRLGGEIEATDDRLINALKLKLPGKFVKVTHEVRKDNNGKDRANIVRFEKVGKGSTASTSKGKGKVEHLPTNKPTMPTEDEDW